MSSREHPKHDQAEALLASREGRRGSMADRFPAQNNRPGN